MGINFIVAETADTGLGVLKALIIMSKEENACGFEAREG